MPVTYISSTGALSFLPVALRDQAVGPIEVARTLSPPDEIFDLPDSGTTGAPRRYRPFVLVAALTAAGVMLLAG